MYENNQRSNIIIKTTTITILFVLRRIFYSFFERLVVRGKDDRV